MAVKYYKMSFLIDIVFIAVSFVSKENLAFLIFPLIISGVLPITMLGFDEKFKWTHYSGALPYSAACFGEISFRLTGSGGGFDFGIRGCTCAK